MIRAARAGLRSAAAGSAVLLALAPSAWAISPPVVDAGVAPPSGSTGPAVPMSQNVACATTGVIPGTDPATASPSQEMLNLAGAWRFSRGEGQTVAVIDTGVKPGPRLTNLEGGGDYVAGTDGLQDCDGHGTLVAGIIAGQPGDDGFSGVAPAAKLIAIRQTSSRFTPRTDSADPAQARVAVAVASLARAVVHAADLGARVINISAGACLPADNDVDQTALGAALRYAAVEKDAVIVAAAGNAGPTGLSGGEPCRPNPISGVRGSDDPRNWAGVTSVSIPSWWQPYVLSVGSLTPTGQPSDFTMTGPWVGIAAPGENIVSVSNGDGGLANGQPNERGQLSSLNGTSYAAAYTSGVAALVRSRFPELDAAQVIQRLTATAHNGAREPSNIVGAGTLDPVAALTWQLPPTRTATAEPAKIAAPAPITPRDHTPRTIAFVGAAALAAAVAAFAFAAHRRKDGTQ